MALDFSTIDIDGIIDDAAKRTDDNLAGQISSLTRMTDDEVKKLFPKAADAKKLVELMKIVKSAERRNKKISSIAKHSEKFAGVMLTLLNKFV